MEKIKIADTTKSKIAEETNNIARPNFDKEHFVKEALANAKDGDMCEIQRHLLRDKPKLLRYMQKNKDKEWCEQYYDFYGNTHPKYGGTLTDLFTLPVGQKFYVANGCYDATIIVDEDGDKCVLTCCTCFKLTKDNHSMYIK